MADRDQDRRHHLFFRDHQGDTIPHRGGAYQEFAAANPLPGVRLRRASPGSPRRSTSDPGQPDQGHRPGPAGPGAVLRCDLPLPQRRHVLHGAR